MIKLINKEEIDKKIDNKSIIIVPSYCEYFYKNKYYKKNYNIYNFKTYVLKCYDKSKTIINDKESFAIMYRAFLSVKDKLLKYYNVNNVSFINDLLNTYDYFYELSFKDNDKIHDLKMIFKTYEDLMDSYDLINERLLIKNVIKNYEFSGTYVFLGLENINNLQIDLIKKMGSSSDVFIYYDGYDRNLLDKMGISLKQDNLTPDIKHDFYALNDIEEEVKFVLNDISKKVLEGAKYKDFMIVVPSISDYEPYFEMTFDIPYSKQTTSGVLTARFIKLLSYMFKGDFSCKTFLNLLKLNVFDVSKEIIDQMDNYVYTWDKENESFYIPFTKKCKNVDCKLINNAKEEVINQLKYLLENVLNENKVGVIAKWFWIYLQESEIDKRLFNQDEDGYLDLVSSLECMCDYLDYIKPERFFEVLSSLIIPKNKVRHMNDEVKVCKLNSACYLDKSYVYLMGASLDDLPGKFKLGALISKQDITEESLTGKIDDFKCDATSNYLRLVSQKNVIITYHKLSLNLKLLSPSSLVDIDLKKYDNKLYNKKLIIYDYAIKLSNKEVLKQESQDDLIKKVNLSSVRNMNLEISKKTALELYTNSLTLSPSSIETFAKCPFYFFCSYGLKLNIKEKNTFDNREIGSLIHYVLEKIITNDYDTISLTNLDEKANYYAFEYLNKNDKLINNTVKYIVKMLSLNLVLVLKKILKEKELMLFKPKYTEFKISDDAVIKTVVIKLDNGEVKIEGVVDRIDTYEEEDKVYYVVIDYKTGGKKLRLDECLEGLNLQMLLYLLAIKNSTSNAVLSGVLYYPALVKEKSETRELDTQDLEKSVQKRLLAEGMINCDSKVINAFSNDNVGDFINVTTRGKLDDEKTYTLSELSALFNYVKFKLTNIGNEILNGNINVNPVQGKVDACDFCKFSSICAFDKNFDKSRRLKNYKNKEVFEKIEGDFNA